MKNSIKEMLGLQHLWFDGWEIKEDQIIVKVRVPRKFCMCPHCTTSTKKIHQVKIRRIKHSIWQEKTVVLHYKQRRFYCRKCNKAFTEYARGITAKSTMYFPISLDTNLVI